MESISCQTLKDIVWAIVNDGEKGPVDHVANLARERGISVVVIHNKEKKGPEGSSNIGIRATCSKYVVIHDDDDSWDERFLEETTSFLDKNCEYSGVATQSRRINEIQTKNGIYEIEITRHNTHVESTSIIDVARPGLFPPIAFLFDRKVLDVIGYYDEIVLGGGDWDFHMRFVEKFQIGVIPRPLAFWHCRQNLLGGAYGNSRYDENGSDMWKRFEAIVSNRLIRRDMAAGRIGMGIISGFQRLNSQQINALAVLEYGVGQLSKKGHR